MFILVKSTQAWESKETTCTKSEKLNKENEIIQRIDEGEEFYILIDDKEGKKSKRKR